VLILLACLWCAIADGVDEGRYLEPDIEADYCEQEPETPNAEPALPEDLEDGKFNLIL
jgi:glutamine synthetase